MGVVPLLVIACTAHKMEVVQYTMLLICTGVVLTLTALCEAGIIVDFIAVKRSLLGEVITWLGNRYTSGCLTLLCVTNDLIL
jgi:hypothetical protein